MKLHNGVRHLVLHCEGDQLHPGQILEHSGSFSISQQRIGDYISQLIGLIGLTLGSIYEVKIFLFFMLHYCLS